MRRDIAFQSAGLTCRGWFYPGEGKGARPTVVMSHGVTAVKEQHLAHYAERFAGEGFSTLVFDYRYLGASGGEPRGRVIPHLQHEDIRAALTHVVQYPEVDANRIALWGTSFSGGHALFVGALDPRVKAVLVQVPGINLTHSLMSLISRPVFQGLLATLADDQAARSAGGQGGAIPVVAKSGEPSFLAAADAYEWFTGSAKIAPNWLNSISLESIARAAEYVPDAFIELIAPRPLLMQVATKDSLIPVNLARQAFHRAGEPKTLELYDCGHFDPYANEPWASQFLAAQVRWLKENL
ncbi:MAG: alpha/beta hydrolase [Alphaproteobacteria bacterium]|nr:alpha/beta hydrolase [Alphaproteobacteria bacterium]